MNVFLNSYKNALNRHRVAFSAAEQYQYQAIQLLEQVQLCLAQGGKVVWMGNGGSAADAQHLAAEFMVRYRQERSPLSAIALTTNSSILTAHSNDYEFSTLFERQVQGLVKPQDLVVGLTTSGNSANVNLGIRAANKIGAFTVALTGGDGGQVAKIAKLSIIINNDETSRIQEIHMFLGHWLCESLDFFYNQPTK